MVNVPKGVFDSNYHHSIMGYVNDAELGRLKEYCRDNDVTVSAIVRHAVLNLITGGQNGTRTE